MKYVYNGITYYFIDNLDYFGAWEPYSDTRTDVERFTFFCKAVLSILPVIDFRPTSSTVMTGRQTDSGLLKNRVCS